MWGAKRNGTSSDPARETEDLYKCVKVLDTAESRWTVAGRLRCVPGDGLSRMLTNVAAVTCSPTSLLPVISLSLRKAHPRTNVNAKNLTMKAHKLHHRRLKLTINVARRLWALHHTRQYRRPGHVTSPLTLSHLPRLLMQRRCPCLHRCLLRPQTRKCSATYLANPFLPRILARLVQLCSFPNPITGVICRLVDRVGLA